SFSCANNTGAEAWLDTNNRSGRARRADRDFRRAKPWAHPNSWRYNHPYLSIMRRQDIQYGRMADGGAPFRIWTVAMNENQLIKAIRERAAHPTLRNDFAHMFPAELRAPATTAAVDEAERAIGYAFHPFHRRLLTEVGNGGFGPGYGLIGLPGGA